MSSNFAEIILDKNLTLYVFILPIKLPTIKVTIEDITVESFNKNDSLVLKQMKFPVKRLETRAYASVPCILLIYLVKNHTTNVTQLDINIQAQSKAQFCIHELTSQPHDLKELKICIFEFGNLDQFTFPIVLNAYSDALIEFHLKGSVYVDQRKINISKHFGLESVLPFFISSKVKHISKFDYMLELSCTNLMPFDLHDISYTFTAYATLPKYLPKAKFADSIKSLVQTKRIIPIQGTPSGQPPKKFGKIKIFWKIDDTKEYSTEIREEPSVDVFQTKPDYLMISVKSCPKEVFVNTQFDFEIEVINVSSEDLTFVAHPVNTEDVGSINTESVHYSAEIGSPISINFSAIPVREGLVKLPPIKFVMDNSASFTYNAPSGVLVKSTSVTHV